MRAVDIKNGSGPADALFINDDVPTPVPKDGEVLVQVVAFGLNRMDLSQREGKYPVPPQAPKTLGVEFSGYVSSLGPSVSDFKKGDEVFGLAYGGAYAEYIVISSLVLIHKPPTLTFETAASIPEAWFTATQSLFLIGNFQSSQSLLFHAGASSVGLAAIQLAASHGASKILVTASTQEKLDFCKSLGATHGFNYKEQDWVAEVKVVTEEDGGVDVIIDPVARTHLQGDFTVAKRDGRVVLLALMSGGVCEKLDVAPVLMKRLRLEGTTLRSRSLEYQRELRDRFVEEALPGIVDGKHKVAVEKVFNWEDIVEAHKLMESNQTKGKIVCVIRN